MFTNAKINEIVYNSCVKEYVDLYKPAFGVNHKFLRQYDLFFLVVVAH